MRFGHQRVSGPLPSVRWQPPQALSAQRSLDATPGQRLDEPTRRYFEPRFGVSFADVRVHADVSADRSVREIGGLAYTVGSSIAFRRGLYDPRTRAGQAILAHELAHVVQQSSASPDGPVSAEQSEHEEREARAAARAVLRGATANISTRRRSRAVRRVTATEDLRTSLRSPA
jgi:hypothetical protein